MFEKEFAYFMTAIYFSPAVIAVMWAVLIIIVVGKLLKIKVSYRVEAIVLSIVLIPFFYWHLKFKPEIEQAQAKRLAEFNAEKAKYEAAKAVFDEQCKKAGEKIYRTVDNVEGVMLLKVRGISEKDGREWNSAANPMLEGAAMDSVETESGAYIASFLRHGGLTTRYLFVDVLEEDGSISRYSDQKGNSKGSRYFDEVQKKVIKNPSNPARYAVTYENNVDPELRKHWVAGVTIRIIDRQTNELLAEKTVFSFEPWLGSTATGRMPWVSSNVLNCPELPDYPTRTFAFQVLKFSK